MGLLLANCSTQTTATAHFPMQGSLNTRKQKLVSLKEKHTHEDDSLLGKLTSLLVSCVIGRKYPFHVCRGIRRSIFCLAYSSKIITVASWELEAKPSDTLPNRRKFYTAGIWGIFSLFWGSLALVRWEISRPMGSIIATSASSTVFTVTFKWEIYMFGGSLCNPSPLNLVTFNIRTNTQFFECGIYLFEKALFLTKH